MQEDRREYFRNRAEDELEAGRAAQVPEAARAHFLLAGYYFDRAFNPRPVMPIESHTPATQAIVRS